MLINRKSLNKKMLKTVSMLTEEFKMPILRREIRNNKAFIKSYFNNMIFTITIEQNKLFFYKFKLRVDNVIYKIDNMEELKYKIKTYRNIYNEIW